MRMRPRQMALTGVLAAMVLTSTLGVGPAAAHRRMIVVQPGQTLSGIAAELGISLRRLMRLNHLTDPNWIYAGQHLRLEVGRHRHNDRAPQRRLSSHRVTRGETLSSIAARYNISVARLVRRNHLHDASRIYVGQRLRIRMVPIHKGGTSHHSPRRHAGFVTHVVRFAETLSGIALHYHVDLRTLVAANEIANPSIIRVGQRLRVPGRHAAGGHPAHQRRRHGSHHRQRHATGWHMPPEMAGVVRGRHDIGRIIRNEARAQHVPPALAMGVAWQESGWQERIVSSAGAIGVMQLLPSTADWVSATMLGRPVYLWDARSNVRAGVALLKHYLRRYHGSRALALAAYYQGQAGTDRYGIYAVSRPYISSILILQAMFARR
jgi:LysM repeat protein